MQQDPEPLARVASSLSTPQSRGVLVATAQSRTALLAGATGLIGGHCLEALLASPLYDRVRVVARRAPAITHPKLEVIVTEFDKLGTCSARIDADDVFCCLGTTIARAGSLEAFVRVDRDYPVELARLAKTNGASQFLLISSVGADVKSPNYYLRTKGEAEAAITEMGYDALQILRPSLLLGERAEFRWKEKFAEPFARLFSFAMVGPLEKYRAIEGSMVARAMVAIASEGQSGVHIHQGQTLRVV